MENEEEESLGEKLIDWFSDIAEDFKEACIGRRTSEDLLEKVRAIYLWKKRLILAALIGITMLFFSVFTPFIFRS